MRKTKKVVKIVIEELEKTGLISSACAKAKIPRSTYYRWLKTDIEFRIATDEAINIGRGNMTDFAESVLLKNMQNGSQRAAEFYLRNNDDRYRSTYARDFFRQVDMVKDKYRADFESLTTVRSMLFNALPREVLFDFANGNKNSNKDSNIIDNRKLNKVEIEKEVQKKMGSDFYKSLIEMLMQTEGVSIKDLERPPMPEDLDKINYND